MPRRRILVLLLIILGGFSLHAYYLSGVAEDAYISFRFAKNLAQGRGFVWNPGEPPVEGFTNFLWVVICAAAQWVGLDLPQFAQWLGWVAGIMTLIYAFRMAREVFRLTDLWALWTCALLAAAGPMACWAVAGMETTFFGMWIVLGVFYLLRSAREGTGGDLAKSALALLFATLTRPEGLVVFGVAAVLCLALHSQRRSGLIGPLLIYVVPFTLYFVWRYRYFGYLLPNTYYAQDRGLGLSIRPWPLLHLLLHASLRHARSRVAVAAGLGKLERDGHDRAANRRDDRGP